jgi:hypothetical protein
MKRAVLFVTLLLSAAGYVFLQVQPAAPAPKLAALMPSGALLYLEAPDFGRLLREWDASKVKADWIESANYAEFSRSNLFAKLGELYGQYGEAAGFRPGLKSVLEIAGTQSALALYGIRDVEFLYVSRVADAELIKSQLWAVRDKFQQRQAGGVSFYLRSDPASQRTVAFAFVKGYLFLATRDDLVAQALELLAGGSNPSVASDRWYREPAAAAPNPGELRLVMNMESLVKSVYFRSYWVQRNVSALRPYWAGVADVTRTGTAIVERRVFLRAPGDAQPVPAPVSNLVALVPPEAGLYKAWAIGNSPDGAALIVQKLIAPPPQRSRDWREAPWAVSPDSPAGTESDLETRIDEQPLPAGAGFSDSVSAVRAMVDQTGARALLLVESTSPADGTFVQMPSVLVLAGGGDWNPDAVRSSLTAAAGNLWTASQLGAGWTSATAGSHPVERLDGLGTLLFAARGPLLFLSNDPGLLAALLDRAGAGSAPGALTYAAGCRYARERSNFERVMSALDFTAAAGNSGFGLMGRPAGAPPYFSGNLASLSRVLSQIAEIRATEEERAGSTVQNVQYLLGQ